MKPDFSLIPAPDRSVEVRKAIPRAWKNEALIRSGGTCAYPGCEVRTGLQYDHMLALGLGGKHAAENIEPLCGPHHLIKTKRDVKMIARAKRLAQETCQGEPARKIQGRGFGSVSRGFDGRLKLTKKATVTHGLSFTPQDKDIFVTPHTGWGSTTKWWIDDVTSTTFKIVVDANPGLGFEFSWQAWGGDL